MSKCEFKLTFQGSKQQLMEKIQSEVQKANGRIYFQNDFGNFNIPILTSKIEGTFHFQENQVLVQVIEKPFFLTCSKIESQIGEYLAKQKD